MKKILLILILPVQILFAQSIDNVGVVSPVICKTPTSIEGIQIDLSGVDGGTYNILVYKEVMGFPVQQPLTQFDVSDPVLMDLPEDGVWTFELENDDTDVIEDSYTYDTGGWPTTVSLLETANDDITCFGFDDGEIEFQAFGGTVVAFNYTWELNGSPDPQVGGNVTFSNLSPGNYTVTAIDNEGCPASALVTITEPLEVVASPSVVSNYNGEDISCFGEDDGIVTVGVTNAVAGVSVYDWTGPSPSAVSVGTTQLVPDLVAGEYSITVTDGNGCVSQTETVTLTEPDQLLIDTYTSDDMSCFDIADGFIDVSVIGGTGNLTYSWISLSGYLNTTVNDALEQGLDAGEYTVTITDANGCGPISQSGIIITEPAEIEFSVAVTSDYNGEDIECNGNIDGQITITPTVIINPYDVSIDNAATYTLTNQTGISIVNGLSAGDYDIVLRDGSPSQCVSAVQTISISEPEPISITSFTDIDPTCAGVDDGEIQIIVSGGTPTYVYSWFDGLGNPIPSITTATASSLFAGDYSVSVTDINGCNPATTNFSLNEPSPIVLDALATNVENVSCNGASNGSITGVSLSGGSGVYSTYAWTSLAGYSSSDADITGLGPDTYTLLVSDNTGCESDPAEASLTIIINEPSALEFNTPISTSHLSCFGLIDGAISADVIGGTTASGLYSYDWNDGTASIYPNADEITGVSAGFYDLTVTDDNGCPLNEASIEVEEPDEIVADVTINADAGCNGGTDGEIEIIPSGGDGGPYTIYLSGTATIVPTNHSALSAGSYSYEIEDASGCISTPTLPVNVIEEDAIQLNAVVTDATCYLGADGQIVIAPTGGTGAYTLTDWLGDTYSMIEGNTEVFTNLSSSTYLFTIENNDGSCNQNEIVPVGQALPIIINTFPTDVTVNGASDGSINTTVANIQGTPSYSWTGPSFTSTLNNISGLSPGNYNITVTDDFCSRTDVVAITEPSCAVQITNIVEQLADCHGDNAQINWLIQGGVEPYTNTLTGDTDGDGVLEILVNAQQFSSPPTGGYAYPSTGNYILEVTDANGCPAVYNFNLTQPDPLIVSELNSSDVTCPGGNNGTFEADIIGGTIPYASISYSGLDLSPVNPNSLTAGEYIVEVIDDNDCSTNFNFTILEPNEVEAYFIVDDPTCELGENTPDSNGEATVVVSGGQLSTYTYLWNDPAVQSTQTAVNLSSGPIQVSVQVPGCTSPFLFDTELTAPAPVLIDPLVSVTDIDCFSACTGEFDVNATGTGVLNYTWYNVFDSSTPIFIGNNITGLCSGLYRVTVEDENNCIADSQIDYPAIDSQLELTDPAPFNISITNTGETIIGACDGTAIVSASGGTPPYSYLWDNGSSSAALSSLCAGLYSVDVEDGNNCVQTSWTTINDPSCSLTLTVDQQNDPVCFDDLGNILWSASGGVLPYKTYLLSGIDTIYQDTMGPAISWVFADLEEGTYNLHLKDAADQCFEVHNFNIISPEPPKLELTSVTGIQCFGDSPATINLTASGGTSPYVVDNGGVACMVDLDGLGFLTPFAGVDALPGGNYDFTMTDSEGCLSNILSVPVPDPEELIVSLTLSNAFELCPDSNSVDASVGVTGGTGVYSVSWQKVGDLLPFNTTDFSVSNLSAGDYIVTIDDASACPIVSTPFTIGDLEPLSLTIVAETPPTCYGYLDGFVSVQGNGGNGGYNYLWSPSGNTNQFSYSLSADDYLISVTDANGCAADFTINVPETPEMIVSISETEPISCLNSNDGELSIVGNIINGTPTYSYQWQVGGAPIPALLGGNALTISSLSADIYGVVVTDNKGCTATASYTLDEPNELLASVINAISPNCNGGDGSAEIDASGGLAPYTYSWEHSSEGIISNAVSPANLPAGNYEITVTDTEACTAELSFTMNEPDPINLNIGVDPVSCFGISDGSVISAPNGGVGTNYQFRWFDDSSNSLGLLSILEGQPAGDYQLEVEDQAGCIQSESFTITQPSILEVNLIQTVVSCNGGSDAEIQASAFGGSPGYSYSWSDTQTGPIADNLSAGQISLTVTDINECTLDTLLLVVEEPALILDINHTITSCEDGMASAIVSGGVPSYNYSWSNGAITPIATNLSPGSYTLTVTDAEGCTISSTEDILPPSELIGELSVMDTVSCFGLSDGVLEVNMTSGNAPFRYSIDGGLTYSDPMTTPILIDNLSEGDYIIYVKDVDLCTELLGSIYMPEPNELTLDISGTDISCFGANDGILNLQSSGGLSPFDFSINTFLFAEDTINQIDVEGLSQDEYMVTVTDRKGCTATNTSNIEEPEALSITSTIVSDFNGSFTSCSDSDDGVISVSMEGGILPYEYDINLLGFDPQILSSSTFEFSNLTAGEYNIQVIDGNGCLINDNIEIISPETLELNLAAVSTFGGGYQINCFGAENGVIEVLTNGGVAPFDYSFDGGTSFVQIDQGTDFALSDLAAGFYSLVVRDANNCLSNLDVNLESPNEMSLDLTVSSDYNGFPISCFGEDDAEITAHLSGGVYPFNYSISGVFAEIEYNNQDSIFILGDLEVGNYQFEVVDANGCSLAWAPTSQAYIVQPDEVEFDYTIIPISCNEEADAEIQFSNFIGGTGAFTLQFWNNTGLYEIENIASSLTVESYSGLQSGEYYYSVTDANNCLHTDAIFIDNPLPLNASIEVEDVSCFNDDSGAITINIEGGSLPYVVNYADSEIITEDSETSFSGLLAQENTIIIYDANLCSTSTNFVINQPSPISTELIIEDVVCYGAETGTAELIISGGTSPYETQLIDTEQVLIGEGTFVEGLIAGEYLFSVTDNQLCNSIVEFTINESNPLIIEIDSISHQTCSYNEDGAISISVLNNQGPFEVFWSHGLTNEINAINLSPGEYDIVVIDEMGCYGSDSTEIYPIETIELQFFTNDASCQSTMDGVLSVEAMGGNPPYDFMLYYDNQSVASNFSDLSLSTEDLISGDYSVLVIDQNNCEIIENTSIAFEGGYDCLIVEPTFSPNYDGENDFFSPVAYFDDEVELFIYNRWGQELFYKQGIRPVWSGLSFDGSALPTADYYYIVKFNNPALEDITGVITLIK